MFVADLIKQLRRSPPGATVRIDGCVANADSGIKIAFAPVYVKGTPNVATIWAQLAREERD
jgi:hypothetical protein